MGKDCLNNALQERIRPIQQRQKTRTKSLASPCSSPLGLPFPDVPPQAPLSLPPLPLAPAVTTTNTSQPLSQIPPSLSPLQQQPMLTMNVPSEMSAASGRLRRYTTLTRPEIFQGRVVEYSDSSKAATASTPNVLTARSTKEYSKPWLTNSILAADSSSLIGHNNGSNNNQNISTVTTIIYSNNNNNNNNINQTSTSNISANGNNNANHNIATNGSTYANRKKRLEQMVLRGSRRLQRTPSNNNINNSNIANSSHPNTSSCKRSDSATNESHKSTASLDLGEATENRPPDSSIRLRRISRRTADDDTNVFNDNDMNQVEEEKVEDAMEELTEEEIEKRNNIEKCLKWINQLPAKFSSMHIVQERAPLSHD